MSETRYEITIKEITQETKLVGKDWLKGGEGDPERYGYTPEIEKTVSIEREIYSQNTPYLVLVDVIKAINNIK